MTNEDDRLRRWFDAADWSTLTPRLLAYARFCLSRDDRSIGRNQRTPNDFVVAAVTAVMDGRYPSGQARSLFSLLAGVVHMTIRRDAERSA
ncbi:MAG TPA: hypothetical protein VN605_12930 [Thermoanaerobaculia bacterium]|nr:hypothetical protein [Thermoanaerobaculia bacterium]